MISMVLCVGLNGELGQSSSPDGLPWKKNKEDLAHFKNLTEGSVVVMGGNTFRQFQKMGMENGLPERSNYVITGDSRLVPDDTHRLTRLHGVWDMKRYCLTTCPNPVYIIGGASVYKQTHQYCGKVYLTRINQEFLDADVHINLDFLEGFDKVEVRPLNEYSHVEVWERKEKED